MTETELRLILRGSTKEELENKLVDLFGAIDDQVQQIEQMKRCGNCKYLEIGYAWGVDYCLYHSTERVLDGDPYQLAGCKHWELEPVVQNEHCGKCKNFLDDGHNHCKHKFSRENKCKNKSLYEED